MKQGLRIVWAFLVRDATMAVSYRLEFSLRVIALLFVVSALYFLSQLIGANPALNEYGGFLPFAAIGLAVVSYFQTGFSSFANAIRTEQMMGTLEALLMTPTKIPRIVIASSVWDFFWATLTGIIYIVAASVLYGIKLQGNPLLAVLVLLLTTLVFASLGVISASFIMVFKRGDPIGFLVGGISTLLGGVFYPVSALPPWLQKVSYALPVTYGLDGLRGILLKGESLSAILPKLTVLLGFAIISVPLSLFCFNRAVLRAQREGTLLQY
jgi:ABC-2 type transport system permease protein